MIDEQLIDQLQRISQLEQQISQLEQLNNQLLYAPYFIIDISSAAILICLYIWLRNRDVKDPSLVWLYSSLLSWAIPKIPVVIGLKWPEHILTIPPERYKYVFSIISSVLFTLTAFKLSRVRNQKSIQRWRVPAIITVVLLSLIAWVLLFIMPPLSKPPLVIDAIASSVASGALGYCFAHSFRKYGHVLLAGLAELTFGIFIVRQFYIAIYGTPKSGLLAFIFFWNTTMITMLFITLAVAWALSDVSRLKPARITEVENIVALFFDLRGSTRWANEVAKIDLNFVKAFIDELREQAESRASETPLGRPNVVKFLGDGFMYVWKVENISVADSFSAIVKLADDLNNEYPTWKEKFKRMKTPDGIGFGIDAGPGSRFTFENGSDDYLGEPLNIAAKLQDRARPRGGVVIQENLYNLLEDDIGSKFTKKGRMRLGGREIAVRMTEEVEP